MNSKELTRHEHKIIKAQHKEHKAKFNKVRSKVRRLKDISKEDKKVLLLDLIQVNGDLMDVLLVGKLFKNVADYFDTVNAYLRSEVDVYKYNVPLYLPSKMGEIMEIIRKFHNKQDRYDYLRSQIMEL